MTAARWGLLALLVLAPLPFGCVEPGAVLALELAALLIAAVALRAAAREPLPRRTLRLDASVAAWAGLVAVGLLQIVPAPAAAVAALAPATARLRDAVAAVTAPAAGAPLSLTPADTLDGTLRLVAYGLAAAAAVLLLRSERPLRTLASAITLSASFQALYGAAEYVSGHQHIFGYAKKFMLESATGTFINRNHFASYLAACLPFALATAWGTRRRGDSRSWLKRVADLDHPDARRRLAGLAGAVAIWAGVLLSFSRAGLALAALATILFPLLLARGRRAIPAVVLVLLVPAAALLLWQDVRSPVERLVGDERVTLGQEARLPVWKAALPLVASAPVLGSGYGAFESSFALRQPAEVVGRWDHAHNDWIEAAVDGGLATAALLAVLLAALAAGLRAAVRHRDGAHPFRVAAALAAGVLAVHSCLDFPLRIPAIALTLAVCLGIAAAPHADEAPARFARR